MGYFFSNENRDMMEIQTPEGKIVVKKLMLNRFDSDRKMMSVLVEYEGKNFLLAKGADNVLLSRSVNKSLPHDFEYKVNSYFDQGYRVLFMAIRLMS